MEKINLINLNELCKNKGKLMKQLEYWGLIPREGEYKCEKCGDNLKLMKDEERVDGYRWICLSKISKQKQKRTYCRNRIDMRTGTFFEKSHLSIFQILGFVNLWVGNATLLIITEELDITYKTAVEWSSFCREVIFNDLINNSEKLGGEGIIVEIDESKFGKRKYHRGHRVEGHWVFGGYERGTGKVFMVLVEDRSSDTLIPIIKQWIKPGTTIISDYWKAYDCLNSHGYEHLKVNHTVNFKDPETGAHTNAIESTWRAAKAIISAGGRRKTSIPGNLARYMFYKRCAERSLDRKVEFFRMAGELYNPTKNNVPLLDGEITDDDD